jgi:hypothetical protein
VVVSTAIGLLPTSEKVNVHLHDYGVMQIEIRIHWHRNKRAEELQFLNTGNVSLTRVYSLVSCVFYLVFIIENFSK